MLGSVGSRKEVVKGRMIHRRGKEAKTTKAKGAKAKASTMTGAAKAKEDGPVVL